MVRNAFGVNVTRDEPVDFDGEELFEGLSDSKLSMCVRLLSAKSNWNVHDQCLEFFA